MNARGRFGNVFSPIKQHYTMRTSWGIRSIFTELSCSLKLGCCSICCSGKAVFDVSLEKKVAVFVLNFNRRVSKELSMPCLMPYVVCTCLTVSCSSSFLLLGVGLTYFLCVKCRHVTGMLQVVTEKPASQV